MGIPLGLMAGLTAALFCLGSVQAQVLGRPPMQHPDMPGTGPKGQKQTDNLLSILAQQRNGAMDAVAQCAVAATDLQKQVEELTKTVEDLTKRLEATGHADKPANENKP